jgi:hypothetical protein
MIIEQLRRISGIFSNCGAALALSGFSAEKKYTDDFLSADHAHQFTQGAIKKEHDRQPHLDYPEMGPYDFRHQVPVCVHDHPILSQQRKDMFDITYNKCGEKINAAFPGNVIEQWFTGKFIHEGQAVNDQDNLPDQQSADCRSAKSAQRNPVLALNQTLGDGKQQEGEEKKDHWRQDEQELVLYFF